MTSAPDLIERLQGWVDGFDRHEHVSTWVARELMAEAIARSKADQHMIQQAAKVLIELSDQVLRGRQ